LGGPLAYPVSWILYLPLLTVMRENLFSVSWTYCKFISGSRLSGLGVTRKTLWRKSPLPEVSRSLVGTISEVTETEMAVPWKASLMRCAWQCIMAATHARGRMHMRTHTRQKRRKRGRECRADERGETGKRARISEAKPYEAGEIPQNGALVDQ
jgi:hypothetical protein